MRNNFLGYEQKMKKRGCRAARGPAPGWSHTDGFQQGKASFLSVCLRFSMALGWTLAPVPMHLYHAKA